MSDKLYVEQTINKIKPIDEASRAACMNYWNRMGKPLHSLGKMETLWAQLAGIQQTVHPLVAKRALVVMCADNGVVAEGVTQTGQEVTAIVAENFFDDLTCTSLICKKNNCDQFIVDIGMVSDTPRTIRRKIAYGTKNMVNEPAMTRAEALASLRVGIELAEQLKNEGYQILATGEMGIGNTTTSSAVTAVLLGDMISQRFRMGHVTSTGFNVGMDMCIETVTGRGAGLSDEGLERKKDAIRRAIAINQPDPADPIDVLSKVGGFDLAGLAGVFIGGAAAGLPVVVDGFISLAAALLAARIAPECAAYMIPSHQSKEPGAKLILEALHMEPGLCMDMCLGEGSGAVALLPFLDMAAEIYEHMGTFDDIHVEAYEDFLS
ncbi:MAG: nicotinate-nucleotide--dimethylbenzimidazole phosphoribosyltransferase [bacterium]|nr:nicotinate-nucleotide--dimethylbenzimidazole phosphoribosyltransferase [bacterium]MDY4099248.1 nicotinate-nucleotide--dimethylbenzimidazole phosphoribosyltransferase [Lachnospiraceae bacterium]